MVRFFMLLFLAPLFLAGFSGHRPGKKFKAPKSFVYVPSGTFKDQEKTVAISGFYMMSGEATNLDYREFLHHLNSGGQTVDFEKANVRPAAAENSYFEDPAYELYPVVNVTHEGAQLYCKWLSGILQARNPDFRIEARLPAETEWMYAARGGLQDTPYPHGYRIRNAKGEYLYNFRALGDESIHEDPSSGDIKIKLTPDPASDKFAGPGTCPARVFAPNAFGLYNMSGNVAEMTREAGHTKGGSYQNTGYDIRIDAPDPYAGIKDASPYIGFRVLLTVAAK